MNKKINMENLFAALDEEMGMKLSSKIDQIYHPGSKGEETELNWIGLLRWYLPERYKIDSGFIVDHTWLISDQIDIIIYDRQFTPFIFRWENTLYIPAEGVYAVFEVKQDLTSENFEYALTKLESVLSLERTSADFSHILWRSKKENFNIIWWFLCSKNKSNEVWEAFNTDSKLQLLLCLEKWIKINNSETENNNNTRNILSFFILKLIEKMRSLWSVPALDVDKYLWIIKS